MSYSGAFADQQWPYNPEAAYGACEFHERLIPGLPAKPIRIWLEMGATGHPGGDPNEIDSIPDKERRVTCYGNNVTWQ